MIIIATTTKMMIKIPIAISSSGGFETIPQTSLDPAFPHPSPSGVRSSSPFIEEKNGNYYKVFRVGSMVDKEMGYII
jgi:hypothetical protein